MKREKKPLSHLEALPTDVISKIISKVAKKSREDAKSCIRTCEDLANAADSFSIYREMNLNDIVTKPLLAVNNHKDLMEKCIKHSNPSAHYVKGLLEYFHFNNPTEGLDHLLKAATAYSPILDAKYLYGIINLCTGNVEVGMRYVDQLRDGYDNSKGDQCWRNIKRALHGIGIERKEEYDDAIWIMQPPYECNLNDMDNTCDKCYHYKQMVKFVYTM